MRRIRTIVWSVTLLVAAHISVPAQTADPTRLPQATRQAPDWGLYSALGVLSAPYNTAYNDPVTGVLVRKITSAVMPAPVGTNGSMDNDYSEGGPYISREWGTGSHTVLVRRSGGDPFLADYTRGSGAGNFRGFDKSGPYPRGPLTVAFTSNARDNAHSMFFVDIRTGGRPTLYRFNTETRTFETDATITSTSGMVFDDLPADSSPYWLQSSQDDTWLVFQVCVGIGCIGTAPPQYVVAFNHQTGRHYLKECYTGTSPANPALETFSCSYGLQAGGLDEIHIDREGNYVALLDGGGNADRLNGDCLPRNPAGQRDDRYAEYYWHLWNLNDPNAAAVCKRNIYSGHVTWVRSLMLDLDVGLSWAPNFNYAPATDVVTDTANYSDPGSAFPNRFAFFASHRAGQWIQPVADATQWYWGDNVNDGDAYASGWSLYSGQIWSTGIDWRAVYEKPAIGIKAVYQADLGDPNRLGYTLAQKNSVAEMTSYGQGSFYYDGTQQRLYAWAIGGGSPSTSGVYLYAPTTLHRGIGVGRANGNDLRILCHNYLWSSGGDLDWPFSTTSPDGKLVMFHSNMGKRGGRYDVFVAEVPLSQEGGSDPDRRKR